MKVSVIMGIYNCASTLQEALDSLYAQTFQDFEIVLCEDGSTDDTYEVALRNKEEHSNIVLLRNEHNMGLNVTLNNCLAVAKGEYIARMDGDDISLPERFEIECKFLDEHPEYAIVSCPMIYFDEEGEFGRGKGGFAPTKQTFAYGTPHCHAPCMVRREAYSAVNGYTVDKKLLKHEDYNLWFRMYAIGYRGYNLSECLYAMRDDRNAARRRSFKSRWNGFYSFYLAYKEFNLPFKSLCYQFIKRVMQTVTPEWLYIIYHKRKLSYGK